MVEMVALTLAGQMARDRAHQSPFSLDRRSPTASREDNKTSARQGKAASSKPPRGLQQRKYCNDRPSIPLCEASNRRSRPGYGHARLKPSRNSVLRLHLAGQMQGREGVVRECAGVRMARSSPGGHRSGGDGGYLPAGCDIHERRVGFSPLPGPAVVMGPSTALDVAGLFARAIRCRLPVMFPRAQAISTAIRTTVRGTPARF